MTTAPATIGVALLSHTNVGKTTLARTLLRRDIGAVMDRAHVTEVAEAHVLLRTGEGDELVLWDTPGFGDSVRLQRRLAASGQPLGWFLSQVWDRFADRAFWCSQQAMRAARDAADVVLYVANATEDPAATGYVEPELRILEWLGKPVLVLLNQLGTRADPAADAQVAEQWRAVLRNRSGGTAWTVLAFDAFARCWLQEHTLLQAIGDCLANDKREACMRLAEAWRRRDLEVLDRSAAVIARQMAELARDAVRLPDATLAQKVGRVLQGGTAAQADAAEQRARQDMLDRLDAAVQSSTAELVALHGLTGAAGERILQQLGTEFAVERAPDADKAGLWGGIVSGAVGGLAADLAAGGLTFGAGAILGGIAGACGAGKLTQRINAERGLEGSVVRWSDEFLDARLGAAVVRYLAVAHYGRGRGEFAPGEPAPRWQAAVSAALAASTAQRVGLWDEVRGAETAPRRLQPLVHELLVDTLARLYPDSAGLLRADPRVAASR